MTATAAGPRPVNDLREIVAARLAETPDLAGRLTEANLPAVREAATRFNDCLVEISRATGGDDRSDSPNPRALLGAFGALMALRAGRAAEAASRLLEAWRGERHSAVSEPAAAYPAPPAPTAGALDSDREWLITYCLAVEQVLTAAMGAGRSRVALRSLLVRLELSQDAAGRMFGVSGETIRRWERGHTPIPTGREAEILAAEAALRRLLDLFRPERLAAAVRRPAELFEGNSAYEWILRGRIGEVADRYEVALSYQG